VDRRDHGLRELGDGLVDAPSAVHGALLLGSSRGELGDIRSRHEGLIARAVEDHHLHRLILRQGVEGLHESLADLRVEGVQLVRAVERNDGHAVVTLLQQNQ
jgi:hypothetical protein